jgi:tetratricopeptide (TPR) repeat protein
MLVGAILVQALCAIRPAHLIAQTNPLLIAPPRTITDVAAILDQEKPDPEKIASLKADADKTPPPNASQEALAKFYYERAQAHAALSQFENAISDAGQAIELGKGAVENAVLARYRQFLVTQYWQLGEPKKGLQILLTWAREADIPGPQRGQLPGVYAAICLMYLQIGDLRQVEAYARRAAAIFEEARTSPRPGWRAAFPLYRNVWESSVQVSRAFALKGRGRFREAEDAFARAEALKRASIADMPRWQLAPPVENEVLMADRMLLQVAKAKLRQGRFVEAEVDARRVLMSRLKADGKYSFRTPFFIDGLAEVLMEQGRFGEAEQLIRTSLEIQRTLGTSDDTYTSATILARLGAVLDLQGRQAEAVEIYASLDRAVANWDAMQRDALTLNASRVYLLYTAGQVETGIAAAQALLRREINRVGEKHADTAIARGILAVGLAKAGREEEALREFQAAIPILVASLREVPEEDETIAIAARRQRLQTIIEAYIALLGRRPRRTENDIATTFALADAIRGQAVQRALAEASARMTAQEPGLAALARKFQDLTKEVNAQLGLLNNVLSLSSAERDEKIIGDNHCRCCKASRRARPGRSRNSAPLPEIFRADRSQPAERR